MRRSLLAVLCVIVLGGCSYKIQRGPRLEDAGPDLLGGEWAIAALDADDVTWARDQALAFFRAPVRRRLETIPIYLSRCDSPELAGAYCQGGLPGIFSCGSSDEEIDVFYSLSRELAEWGQTIERERLRTSNPDSFFTASLWFSGIIHRRVHFPLSKQTIALRAIQTGLRDVLVAILVHEYFHALAGDGLVDAAAISDEIDSLDPEVYPIANLVASGRDAYPWWLFLHRSEEGACLAAEYHLVFGYEVPPSLEARFAGVVDGRRGIRTPVVVRIPGDGAEPVTTQPEK